MAQHTGTADRSSAPAPAAFLAGSLFAVAAIATVIVLALALGVRVTVQDGAAAGAAGAAPAGRGTTYDGRLDPIEEDYIRSRMYPRNGATSGTDSQGIGAGTVNENIPVAPRDGLVVANESGGVLYTGIPYEAPSAEPRGGSNGTRFAQ